MEWDEIYETGHKQIDSEHKTIVNLITDLEYALEKGFGDKMSLMVLKNLVDYVNIHFKNEEKIMKEVGFWDLKRHKRLHQDLVKEVKSIVEDFGSGRPWSPKELIGFLQHWLSSHILDEDKKIVGCLKN